MNIVALGAFCVGGIVGAILGKFWAKASKPTLKTAIAVIGALFTGAPLAFVQDLGAEKWMYPVGVLTGFVWNYIGADLRRLGQGAHKSGKSAWNLSAIKVTVVSAATLAFGMLGLFHKQVPASEPDRQQLEKSTPVVMPCRLAWVFLERYSNARQQYVTPPAFRYSDQSSMRGPIPSVGDLIVITKKRNLVVTGYGSAVPNKKCNRMLEPPHDYRPDTASDFIAGSVDPGQKFLLNDLSFLPTREADPAYVWASVRVP